MISSRYLESRAREIGLYDSNETPFFVGDQCLNQNQQSLKTSVYIEEEGKNSMSKREDSSWFK